MTTPRRRLLPYSFDGRGKLASLESWGCEALSPPPKYNDARAELRAKGGVEDTPVCP